MNYRIFWRSGLSILLIVLHLLLVFGCAPKLVSTEWRTERTWEEKESRPQVEKKEETKYAIDTNAVYLKGHTLEVPVKKSSVEKNYGADRNITKATSQEYNTWVSDESGTQAAYGAIGGVLVGVVIGILAKKGALIAAASLGGLFAIVGATEGVKKKHYETIPTGPSRTETTHEGVWIESLTGTNTLFADAKAEGTPIQASSEYFEFTDEQGRIKSPVSTFTDSNGIAKFFIAKWPDNWGFTTAELMEQVRSWKLIKEIKLNSITSEGKSIAPRDSILNKILDRINERTYPVMLATTATSYSQRIVENGEGIIYISGKEILEDQIYLAIEDFINLIINSKIRQVLIEYRDYDTHVLIENANIAAKTDAPIKEDVARLYFEGDLLTWALNKISDYMVGGFEASFGSDGIARFTLFVPYSLDCHITHPKYNYVKQSLDFRDSDKKIIYQTEVGQKMRVKIVDK